MSDAEPWRQVLVNPGPGDHIILWSDESPESDEAIATFVRGGLARDDFVLVTMPRAELADLERRLRPHGIDLQELVNEGSVLRIPVDEASFENASDLEGLPAAIDSFLDLALSMGKSGLTVLGRVAPVYFESGDYGEAERIEHLAHENRRFSRILCVYNGKRLTLDRLREGVRVTRQHTHAMTALGKDRFFVEAVNAPVEP